jgi:glycosyltransferase involved in cell wall biosynthesis
VTESERRVLFSTPMTFGGGGVAHSATEQVRGIAAEGCSVTVLTTGLAPGAVVPPGVRMVRTFTVGDRRLPHRPFGRHNVLRWHDRCVASFIRHHAEEFDVAHVWPGHCTATLAAARGAGLPALREAPNAHTTETLEQAAREQATVGITLGREQPMRYDVAKVEREEREFDLASAILCPSSYVERSFLDRGFAPERLARNRYGFDPARFPAPGPRRSSVDHRFTALFAGRAEPTKGLHYALEAWHRSGAAARKGRFRIVGTFVPGYAEALGPLLDHPSVERSAHTDDIGAEMRAADVLVLASVTEGSALVTYEAQASGAALLVSDATGADVEQGVQGLVHPARDVTTLAEQLRAVSEDHALLARLQAGALAHRDELTWSAAAKVLVADYEARARC